MSVQKVRDDIFTNEDNSWKELIDSTMNVCGEALARAKEQSTSGLTESSRVEEISEGKQRYTTIKNSLLTSLCPITEVDMKYWYLFFLMFAALNDNCTLAFFALGDMFIERKPSSSNVNDNKWNYSHCYMHHRF